MSSTKCSQKKSAKHSFPSSILDSTGIEFQIGGAID